MMRVINIKGSTQIFTVLLLLILQSACTSFPSENINPAKNSRANFQKDLSECKEDHPESSAGLHYKRWAECMNLKGWK